MVVWVLGLEKEVTDGVGSQKGRAHGRVLFWLAGRQDRVQWKAEGPETQMSSAEEMQQR